MGSLLVGAASAGVVFGLIFGLPLLIRSAQRWTTAVLFSSLTGWQANFAAASSALAIFWLVVLGGLVYSPIAEIAPETAPTQRGVFRAAFALNALILALVIPLGFGAVDAIASGQRGLAAIRSAPTGFLHIAALALAVTILLPWVIWRRVFLVVTRRKRDMYAVEIELRSYDAVVEALETNFERVGLPVRRVATPIFVRLPRRIVDTYGPRLFRSPEPYQIGRIATEGADLTIYASLLDLVAERQVMGRARMALLGQVPPNGMWWTRSESARSLEGSILKRNGAGEDCDVAECLAILDVGSNEWQALQREYLLLTSRKTRASRSDRS